MWVFFHANNDQTVEICIPLPCEVAETTEERGMKARGCHSILYETVLMSKPVQCFTLSDRKSAPLGAPIGLGRHTLNQITQIKEIF